MHGKVPSLRARKRPKKSADSWLTPQQQSEAALKLIQPVPKQRAECEARILAAIEGIHNGKVTEKQWVEEQKQAPRRKLVKKLRAAEIASADLLDEFVFGVMKGERERLEQELKELSGQRRHGGTRRSFVKEKAAYQSWILLGLYGHHRPALTEGGPWHQLAAVLFGYTEEGLFNFDYLKLFWRRICKYGSGLGRPYRAPSRSRRRRKPGRA